MKFEFHIENSFINSDFSDKIINYFVDKLHKSDTLSDSKYSQKIRTSSDYYIDTNLIENTEVKDLINNLKIKISQHSNLPIENQELLTIIRYKPGEEFKPHYDGLDTNSDYFQMEKKLGGQRLKTYIICLKQAEMGGSTGFININKFVTLQTGDLIWWNNVDENGQILSDSLHCGRCPIIGEKWILTCWIRENKYIAVDRNNIYKKNN
jgi:hypothetical protein